MNYTNGKCKRKRRKRKWAATYGHRGNAGMVAYNVTDNSVTNVINTVMARSDWNSLNSWGGWNGYPDAETRRRGRNRRDNRERHERKPKLWRYAKTFGLVDSDKVLRMDDGEIAAEALNVMDYAARDVGKSIKGIGNNAVELAGSVAGIAGLAVKAAYGLGRMVMSIFN